ncbi:MAG TPA: hypothetical protein VMS43_13855 [Allosphingosinicella sp.]|nr:hypothetical protein [Allosphingosinicella sp.]
MKRPILLMSVLLAGCGTTAARVPIEPTVRIVEVRVPVPQPCPALERIGPRPDYPDSNPALAAAIGLAAKVRLLLAGRVQRIAREEAAEGAMAACASPPVDPPGG